jgi:hypothetical protein
MFLSTDLPVAATSARDLFQLKDKVTGCDRLVPVRFASDCRAPGRIDFVMSRHKNSLKTLYIKSV